MSVNEDFKFKLLVIILSFTALYKHFIKDAQQPFEDFRESKLDPENIQDPFNVKDTTCVFETEAGSSKKVLIKICYF